jgi:proteasome accessory factor B
MSEGAQKGEVPGKIMAKNQNQSFSRPPWERMMRFHNLIQEESFPNCSKLASEFEVSLRTIMRDVDFMRDRLNLPIEFDSRRNGYHYTEPVEQFPQLPFTEAEIFA